MYYCAKNGGFYVDRSHYTKAGFLDSDVVQITQEEHEFLIAEQANGLVITANDAGYPITIEYKLTGEELLQRQCDAIDVHISHILKTANVIGEPADYDNLGELALYVNSNNNTYRIEAQTLTTFVESCHAIQYDIKNGVVVFDSINDVIAALPKV